MTLISGDYAGIIFCNATDSTYYLFRINTDGSYSLLLFDSPDSEGTPLAKGSISIDLSQANLIGVVVDKGTIGLYVNRQLIRSVSDSTYTHGRIGVLARNNGDAAEAVFCNAKVWAL